MVGNNQPRKKEKTQNVVYTITALGFLFGYSVALLAYVASSYFQEAINSDRIGFFYIIASVIVIVAILNLHNVFRAFGRGRTLLTILMIQIMLLAGLTIVPVTWIGAILFLTFYTLYGVLYALWNAILEAYSTDGETGRIRGLFLSLWSLGSVLGPLSAMTVLDAYGFHSVIAIVLVLYVVMFIIVLFTLRDIRGHNNKEHVSILETAQCVRADGRIWRMYWVAMLLQFFFATMTIFMPLYLRSLGFAWTEIGLMFTVMLLPFIFLAYPAGLLADKKLGEKELLIVGFFILIFTTGTVAFLGHASLVVWMLVLAGTRVGCALIESMHETYFYKSVDGEQTALMNFFRSSRPIAVIMAAIFASVIQIFFPMEVIFSVLAVVLVTGLYPAFTLKDTL